MDKIINENETFVTTSDLSEWAGPTNINPLLPGVSLRSDSDTVESDSFDWTDRLLLLMPAYPNGFPLGPAEALSFASANLLEDIFSYDIMRSLIKRYAGFSYESIELTVTMSDPKGLVGGVMLGWVPYIDYFDKGPAQTMDQWHNEAILVQSLYNGPNTQLVTFGASQDVTFTIPWTFKFPFYKSLWIQNETPDTQDGRPPHGYPIFWFDRLPSFFVSSVTMPARLRVFAKVKGLKFYGPMRNGVVLQSGAPAMAATAAVAVGTAIVAETLSAAVSRLGPKSIDTSMGGGDTYEKPQAVQMAYLGDTISTGPPIVDPVFIPPRPLSGMTVPAILEILQRPQYIGSFNTEDIVTTVTNNPFGFGSSGRLSNYFSYFSMISRFWRGTINLHVVIPGHPFVEVEFKSRVRYTGSELNDANEFADFAIHRSVFNGTKHIMIPMPYVSVLDYRPCDEELSEDGATTQVDLYLKVVSTMLDVSPTIPAYMFMSAGDDFGFYQPYPPGLYNAAELPSRTVDSKTVLQVGLPNVGDVEIANTRFAFTDDPGTLTGLTTLYDYTKVWSRCIPFVDYDNDGDEEPIPDPVPGFVCASWFPPIDRSADTGAQNSWYFTLDYTAYLSSLFVFYRGGLGFKVVAGGESVRPQDGYLYVSLGGSQFAERAQTHCPFPYSESEIPANANLGAGCVVTPIKHQPVLEITVPYRGTNVWSYTYYSAASRGVASNDDYKNAGVQTNITLQNTADDTLADSIFRKSGIDFELAVEFGLPPPTMWLRRGGTW